MANVFISHASVDLSDAMRLAADLEDLGHSIWLDDWQLRIGDSIIQLIDAGLTDAEALALCLSGHAARSPWVAKEWQSALARQLNGQRVKVIPVKLPGGHSDLPAILADIRYADLDKDWAAGIQSIHRALL